MLLIIDTRWHRFSFCVSRNCAARGLGIQSKGMSQSVAFVLSLPAKFVLKFPIFAQNLFAASSKQNSNSWSDKASNGERYLQESCTMTKLLFPVFPLDYRPINSRTNSLWRTNKAALFRIENKKTSLRSTNSSNGADRNASGTSSTIRWQIFVSDPCRFNELEQSRMEFFPTVNLNSEHTHLNYQLRFFQCRHKLSVDDKSSYWLMNLFQIGAVASSTDLHHFVKARNFPQIICLRFSSLTPDATLFLPPGKWWWPRKNLYVSMKQSSRW